MHENINEQDKEKFISIQLQEIERDIICQLELIRVRNKHFKPCEDCQKTRFFYQQKEDIRKGIEIGLAIAYEAAFGENPLLIIEDYFQHICAVNDTASEDFK